MNEEMIDGLFWLIFGVGGVGLSIAWIATAYARWCNHLENRADELEERLKKLEEKK